MKDNGHITYFEIKNFKRFDALELTDIGQFNLIVGDNNVGKTSLLEALSVLNDKNAPSSLSMSRVIFQNFGFTLHRRGIQFDQNKDLYFKYLAKDARKELNMRFKYQNDDAFFTYTLINGERSGDSEVKFLRGSGLMDQFKTALGYTTQNPSFIPASIDFGQNMVNDYQSALVESMSNKRLIINNLKSIDNQIEEIEVLPLLGKNHVMIGFNNHDLYIPITAMGESAVRVFYYLLHLIKNADGILLIDEVDTGIHYSRMKSFMKNLVLLAQKNNVQLFLSTHSLECQQAFVALFEDEDMQSFQPLVRQFSLIETQEKRVVASGRNFEQLQNAIEIGYETRGGR